MLYCFAAILFVITLQICYVWIFEYLGGPTFEWGEPIFGREGSRKYTHPLFEQLLKFITHGCVFESLGCFPIHEWAIIVL